MNSSYKDFKKIQDKLPDFDNMQKTFCIECEEDDIALEKIKNDISEKIFEFSDKMLEPLMSGSESLSSMWEQSMLEKNEIAEIFDTYRKIQSLRWESNLISITGDEEEMIKWIHKVWEFWENELEVSLKGLCKKLSEGWKKIENEKFEAVYHG